MLWSPTPELVKGVVSLTFDIYGSQERSELIALVMAILTNLRPERIDKLLAGFLTILTNLRPERGEFIIRVFLLY